MFTEILLLLVLVTIWWFRKDKKHYEKYPPGPTRWPFIGNLHQLILASNFTSTSLKILSHKYGDVIFVKMGRKEHVAFNTLETVKEMWLHEFTSFRSLDYEFVKLRNGIDKTMGVIWGNGTTWQNLRRFTARNLRDFGFGKSSTMDTMVNDEIDKFVAYLKSKLDKTENSTIKERDLFSVTMLNVLWRMASGKSYELDDPIIVELVKLQRTFFETTNIGMDIGDIYPVLRKLFPGWTQAKVQQESIQALINFGRKTVKEHREQGTYKEDPESFIDVFLAKADACKDDPETDFTDEQLVVVVLDLILGGSETSSNTLNFGILYMLLNPKVQEKVQVELDCVLAEGEVITSDMKTRLPYTNATVLEILRQSTVVQLPSPREATEDFYFRGRYFIPKGMSCMPNIYAIHHDKEVWGDPQNFRPERFLNQSETEVKQEVAGKLLSFGAGKRYCLGQSLAECTMFLYFARIMKEFTFEKIPGTNPTEEPVLGLTLIPHPYPVRILKRKVTRAVI